MGNVLEILYDVLFQPSAAMSQVSGRRLIGKGFAVFLLSILLPSLAMWLGMRESGLGAAGSAIIILHIAGSLALWIAGTALLHFIAEFYGGRGMVTGLFAALGFAQLPRIFIVPCWIIAALLPDGMRTLIMGLSTAIVLLWVLMLHVKALEATYGFHKIKAVLVLATPFLAMIAFVALVAVFATAQLMPWPQWS